MKIAQHIFGKQRSYRGKKFVGAVVEISSDGFGITVTIKFKSSPGPFDPDQEMEALRIYDDIECWIFEMKKLSVLRNVAFPLSSPKGKWPPLNSLVSNLENFGISVFRQEIE